MRRNAPPPVAALVSGWRCHGKPTAAASPGVGHLAGFGAGALQIGAPPLPVLWLGGPNSAPTVRANIMVYFIVQRRVRFDPRSDSPRHYRRIALGTHEDARCAAI